MQHTPVSRWEWEKLVLRLELPPATKLIALAAATYGNADGSRVEPSAARLAAELDWSEKHVQNQISKLRGLGLLEVTRRHSPGNPTRHQLTFPAAGTDPLPMRTGVDGYRVMQGPKKAGRGGRKPKLTGTPVPVRQDSNQNSGSGEYEHDQNPSSGIDDSNQNASSGETAPEQQSTGTPVPVTETKPELEFQQTGTGVPGHRNWSSPDHKDQTKTNPVVTRPSPPTSTPQDHKEEAMNQPTNPTDRASKIPDPEADYRAARRIVDNAPKATRDAAIAEAAAHLAAQGIVGVKPRIIRAARILTRDAARNHAANQEDQP